MTGGGATGAVGSSGVTGGGATGAVGSRWGDGRRGYKGRGEQG